MTKGYFTHLMQTFYSKAGKDHQVDNDFLKKL